MLGAKSQRSLVPFPDVAPGVSIPRPSLGVLSRCPGSLSSWDGRTWKTRGVMEVVGGSPLPGSVPLLAGSLSQTPPEDTSAGGRARWASRRKECRSCEWLWSAWSLSNLSPAKQRSRCLAWGVGLSLPKIMCLSAQKFECLGRVLLACTTPIPETLWRPNLGTLICACVSFVTYHK